MIIESLVSWQVSVHEGIDTSCTCWLPDDHDGGVDWGCVAENGHDDDDALKNVL